MLAPPKIDCAGCGVLGCPKADEPNPPVVAPGAALPKIFPELVLALPKAEVPPKIDPPAAGEAPAEPNSPPLGVDPNKLEDVVAGVAAPKGLDDCWVAVVAPPKMEPPLAAGAVGDAATDPKSPPVEGAGVAPKGELAVEDPPKIDPPAVLVTVPKRPVPAVLVLVAAGVLPNMEVVLEESAAAVPKVEVVLPPKIEAVSAFGAEKELAPKMFVEAELVLAGADGEQMLNDPKRLAVGSVVEVGATAAVATEEDTTGAVETVVGAVTEPKEKLEAVTDAVAALEAVVTIAAAVTTVVVAVAGAELLVPKSGLLSAFEVTGFTDRSVALVASPKPPKANSAPALVVVGGLIEPNNVDDAVADAAVEDTLSAGVAVELGAEDDTVVPPNAY